MWGVAPISLSAPMDMTNRQTCPVGWTWQTYFFNIPKKYTSIFRICLNILKYTNIFLMDEHEPYQMDFWT
jgi:hypothetical protein